MANRKFKNLYILIFATLAPQFPLYGIYAAFWPNAFHHLTTRMLPLVVTTLLFLLTANLLSYSDVKDDTNKIYNYIMNFAALSSPVASFVFHSNLTVLEDQKVFYEYKTAASNIILALLIAEFCRQYFIYHEKKYAEQLATEGADEAEEE